MNDQNRTISELFEDINRMESTILYFQNRILRKQIAIAEIMESQQVRHDDEARIKPGFKSLTVRTMVEQVLPDMNGKPFHYDELKRKCSDRFPSQVERIERGVVPACHALFKSGALLKLVEKGMVRTP